MEKLQGMSAHHISQVRVTESPNTKDDPISGFQLLEAIPCGTSDLPVKLATMKTEPVVPILASNEPDKHCDKWPVVPIISTSLKLQRVVDNEGELPC